MTSGLCRRGFMIQDGKGAIACVLSLLTYNPGMLTLGKFIPSVEDGMYHSKQWFDVVQTDLEYITLLSQSPRCWAHRQTPLFVFRSYAYRGRGGVETTYIFGAVL